MKDYFFVKFCGWVNLDVPEYESFDDFLDYMIPKIEHLGEDLREQHFYTKRYWLEYREIDPALPNQYRPEYGRIFFKETLSGADNMITSGGQDKGADHYFIENGHITRGTWAYLSRENKILLKESNKDILRLYDLAFMNAYFFILLKHGDQDRIKNYHEKQNPGQNTYSKYLILYNKGPLSGLLRTTIRSGAITQKNIVRFFYYYNFYQNFVVPTSIIAIPIFIFIIYIIYLNFF